METAVHRDVEHVRVYVGWPPREKLAAKQCFHLNLPNASSIHATSYRVGPQQRQLKKEKIEVMIKVCVVEPAKVEWALPIVFVHKKDETYGSVSTADVTTH